MTPSSARGPTASCACGTVRSSRRRGAGRMALPEASAWAIVIGVVLVAVVIGFRPLLARLAARNIGRRKSRVLIVVAGLLVGTAIISSSLVVGDTLSYIFLEDVYARLDAIDELVSNSFNGQLFSFAETNFTEIAGDLAANATPIDGIAPALLKVMPVRNVAGNKGNQQITVMGLNASHEGGFGPLTLLDGRTVDTDRLLPGALRERTRSGGPERDCGPGSHPILRHHEPDDRPRDRRGDRAGRGQGRIREPRDPVHGPAPGAGRVQ